MPQEKRTRPEDQLGFWLRLRPIVAKLFVFGCSILVSLGFLEGLLRLVPSLMSETARIYARGQNEQTWRIGTVSHPHIGYLYPANIKRTFRNGDVAFTYETDAFGFRNSGPWPQKAEVVALGDSMTFSVGVNDDEAWAALLQQNLRCSRIVNLALSGAAPQQYLRIYETYGRSLQPQILLVGLFPGNDLKDAVEFDAWLESGTGGNYKLWQSFRVATPSLQYLLAGLVKRSYLFAFLLDRVRYSGSEYGSHTQTVSFTNGRRLVMLPSLLESVTAKAQPDRQEFHLVIQTLERLHHLAAEQGTHSLVLLFPTKEEIYLSPVEEGYEFDPAASIRATLDLSGVPYLDLGPHFRKQAAEGQHLFFEVDGHPNQKGNILVAEVVLSHLKAHAEEYDLGDWEMEISQTGLER